MAIYLRYESFIYKVIFKYIIIPFIDKIRKIIEMAERYKRHEESVKEFDRELKKKIADALINQEKIK